MTIVKASFVDATRIPLGSGTLTYRLQQIQESSVALKIATPDDEISVVSAGVAADIDLDPGPYSVHIQIGWYDEVFRIVVPTVGPVQLWDLLESSIPYDPPVISLVKQYRDEAVATKAAIEQSLDSFSGFIGGVQDVINTDANRADAAADRAETAADLAEDAVTSGVATNSVTTPKIVDGAVTMAKLDATVQAQLTDARTPKAHMHAEADVTGLTAKLGMKADLVGGLIPQAQIPAIAVTEFLGAVATQSAMLTLAGQRGDWCTRTDRGTDWQLIAEPSTTLANWRERTYPASPVSSVAGRVGAVTLSTADVSGAVATTDARLSDARTPLGTTRASWNAGSADSANLGLTPAELKEAVVTHIGATAPKSHGHGIQEIQFLADTLGQFDDALAETVTAAAGQSITMWIGTQAAYDALPTATKNAVGFIGAVF